MGDLEVSIKTRFENQCQISYKRLTINLSRIIVYVVCEGYYVSFFFE